MFRGRPIRVRFATHGAALSVKNLPQFVSNELLEESFSMFGPIERAIVIVDDRGRPTGKGIVEFANKPSARKALDRCTDGAFLLTSLVTLQYFIHFLSDGRLNLSERDASFWSKHFDLLYEEGEVMIKQSYLFFESFSIGTGPVMCKWRCWCNSRFPRPVTVEPMEQLDEDEGLPERLVSKNPQYHKWVSLT